LSPHLSTIFLLLLSAILLLVRHLVAIEVVLRVVLVLIVADGLTGIIITIIVLDFLIADCPASRSVFIAYAEHHHLRPLLLGGAVVLDEIQEV
jgi:hypothetical protein